MHASAQLLIKVSKTDTFRKTCTVTVGTTNNYPVTALSKYLHLRTGSTSHPLFQFEDGSYLTRTSLTTPLRSLLLLVGLDPDAYASHSFRIGAVAVAGLPDWQIRPLGGGRTTVTPGTFTHLRPSWQRLQEHWRPITPVLHAGDQIIVMSCKTSTVHGQGLGVGRTSPSFLFGGNLGA